MSTKFLNVVIVISIVGIVVISIRDIGKPRDEISKKIPETTRNAQPIASPTPTPDERVLCSSTLLGDIQYKQLTYSSKTKDAIKLDIFGSNSAKTDNMNENLVLNLDSKTDSNYVYYLKNKNSDKSSENTYSITCTQQGIQADILGNKIQLLPNKNSVQVGDTWKSSSNLSSAAGITGNAELSFDYTVADVTSISLFGEKRNAITVRVNFRELNVMEYTVVDGIGIQKFNIELDLEQFGGYKREVKLLSAQ